MEALGMAILNADEPQVWQSSESPAIEPPSRGSLLLCFETFA
ncbi:MAG: hypothetical protein U1F54_18015 [Burkholderiales bacterium]